MILRKLLLCSLFFVVGAAQAATVSVSPDPINVNAGDTFSVSILGTNFTSVLDGGGLDILFDPSIVEVTGASVDTTVWDPAISGINGAIDNTAGSITGLFFNSFANITGDFQIATIDFIAKSVGTTQLQLSEYALNPFASGGAVLPVTLVNGTVNVSAVPLPAAGWLMLSGLGMLVAGARRRSGA